MPDLVLKTGDLRVEAEQAFQSNDNVSDQDSWPSESSEEFGEEPPMASSLPPPSKFTNREDVVGVLRLPFMAAYPLCVSNTA